MEERSREDFPGTVDGRGRRLTNTGLILPHPYYARNPSNSGFKRHGLPLGFNLENGQKSTVARRQQVLLCLLTATINPSLHLFE
jgi:hypothetical protein